MNQEMYYMTNKGERDANLRTRRVRKAERKEGRTIWNRTLFVSRSVRSSQGGGSESRDIDNRATGGWMSGKPTL